MPEKSSSSQSDNYAGQVIDAAARLPGVRIDRDSYLRKALRRYCSEDQIEIAIAESPRAAGISHEIITKVADASIASETTKATGISAAAGIPGGLAVLLTIPGDLTQYFAHLLRVAQKLAYIYGWPDLFKDDEEFDEGTENLLILFVGVMFGVQAAQSGISKVATMVSGNVLKTLPRQALTRGIIYPIVKKVARHLGVSMTKRLLRAELRKLSRSSVELCREG